MYLLSALVLAGIGYWFAAADGGIGNIPFTSLALRLVLSNLVGTGAFLGAIILFLKSLERDRLWRWRRTRR